METLFPHNIPKFICKCCNIKTNNKKDFNKHILTSKHKKLTIVNTIDINIPQNIINCVKFTCKKCNKEYKSRVGLWKHNNFCLKEEKEEKKEENKMNDKEIINLLLTQNKELMNLLKNGIINNTTNNNTTNNNKIFNLNFFLNETCKDAMNISEFVSSIKVNLEELENTGRQGYIEGISKIIVNRENRDMMDATNEQVIKFLFHNFFAQESFLNTQAKRIIIMLKSFTK